MVTELQVESLAIESGAWLHVVEGSIAFVALQETPPSFARAWVGYIACERLVDLSTMIFLVRRLSRRFSTSSFLAREIARTFFKVPGVLGVAVCVETLRLSLRGMEAESDPSGARFAWEGLYDQRLALQREFVERCT